MAPICLSQHFAKSFFCGSKSIMPTPMADFFVERSATCDPSKKENIVLYDADERCEFDASQIILEDAKLVELRGYTRSQVADLYCRSKIVLDTFSTGMERIVFESSLFEPVIVVSDSGSAEEELDYHIPSRFRWKQWNYPDLSTLIQNLPD